MRKISLVLLSALFLAGCAVVNVYVTFPEEKIQEAAEDLLAPPAKSEPVSSLKKSIFTGTAYAQEAVDVRKEIKTDSPVIRAAKQKMDGWREELDNFKKDGFVGETNDFSVVVRSLPSDSAAASRVKKLVSDENAQRKTMMDELLKINNVPPGEMEKFKRIFADTMKKYSPKGTWVQSEDWYRK
ncbi:MAG: DUF1318 domain-containing protein [Candidatus Omnitrophica bacterium]|nr:DUF1318 domain-containing protein [Candidatus Omnitrophota bacterium]